MTQAKPDRSPRRGSETRARTRQVKVALSDAELATLDWLCEGARLSRPAMLRGMLAGPVHQWPQDGSGAYLLPCCGKSPGEIPQGGIMTADPEKVTCRG